MRESRKRRLKKLKLKHIPDFFDDIEEIKYTYRESLHGDTIREYIYCLVLNDGIPVATFEGIRPMGTPDYQKQVYDQLCKQKIPIPIEIWYGILYRFFIAEKIHLWDDTAQLDIDEPDIIDYDAGMEWSVEFKTKSEASRRYFNLHGWRIWGSRIEYRSYTENSHAVNTFKNIFKNIVEKFESAGLIWMDEDPPIPTSILFRENEMIIGQREFNYEIVE